jgi:hypothetical protein
MRTGRGLPRLLCAQSRYVGSHKVEFSFLNGNLIAPEGQPLIVIHDTAPNDGGTRVWQFDSSQLRGTVIPDDGKPLKQELVNELNE